VPRPKHYTEEPSRLSVTGMAGYIRVHGGGFVTRDMLDGTIEELRQGLGDMRHTALLVDLRAVAGYESACLLGVRQFLREAPSLGVSRIAVLATSSVLRTASRLAAHTVVVELRTFEHERPALQWLHPAGVATPRPRPTSSAVTLASG
jgi:SpoIIAA-like